MGDIETKNKDTAAGVAEKKKSKPKVNREEIIALAATRAGMSCADVTIAMNAIEDVIKCMAMEGKTVSLTGFGKFYLQRHKGHPVRFVESDEPVVDYLVYKFSASNVWNAALREADKQCPIQIQ